MWAKDLLRSLRHCSILGLGSLCLALALGACVTPSNFTYTGAALAAMPEQQLTPPGAVVLSQFNQDGGQGMASRNTAYATRYLGSNLSEAEISGYYDRELRARGWQSCVGSVSPFIGTPVRWCKGALEFQFDSHPVELNGWSPWGGQYQIVYATRLIEERR